MPSFKRRTDVPDRGTQTTRDKRIQHRSSRGFTLLPYYPLIPFVEHFTKAYEPTHEEGSLHISREVSPQTKCCLRCNFAILRVHSRNKGLLLPQTIHAVFIMAIVSRGLPSRGLASCILPWLPIKQQKITVHWHSQDTAASR